MQIANICRMNISTFLLVFSKPMFILLTRVYWLTGRLNHLLLWMTIDRQKCNALCHYEKKIKGKKKLVTSKAWRGENTLVNPTACWVTLTLPWILLRMLGSENQFNCKRYIPENELLLTWQVLCWSRSHRMCLFYPLVCTPIKGAINVTQIVWQRLHTSLTGKLSQ